MKDYIFDNEWTQFLNDEFTKDYFLELNKILAQEYQKGLVRPNKNLIFKALNSIKLDKVSQSKNSVN